MFARHKHQLVVLLLLILMTAPSITMALSWPGPIVPKECNLAGGCQNICQVATLVQNILNAAVYLAVFVSAVLFAWAGFLYLTNVANSGQHSRAIEVFKNVAIGLVIILGGWLVVEVIMRTFLDSSVMPWNVLC